MAYTSVEFLNGNMFQSRWMDLVSFLHFKVVKSNEYHIMTFYLILSYIEEAVASRHYLFIQTMTWEKSKPQRCQCLEANTSFTRSTCIVSLPPTSYIQHYLEAD